MKQKIRFRMRYDRVDSFCIAPQGWCHSVGWVEWYLTTGQASWPVCGRVSQ